MSVFQLVGAADLEDEWIFIKTQFAGHNTHIIIIKFLEFINKNYISNLEINNETDYYKNQDKKILIEKFDSMTEILNSVERAVKNTETKSKSQESLLEHLEKIFQEVFENNKKN